MIGIYVRNSLDNRVDEIRQIKKLMEILERNQHIEEGDRIHTYNNYDNLISDLENGIIDTVVIEGLDRLSRNHNELSKMLEEINQYGSLMILGRNLYSGDSEVVNDEIMSKNDVLEILNGNYKRE